MDGVFVPAYAMSLNDMRCIAKYATKPLDVHLMIDRPHRYIDDFAKYADYISFHYEAGSDNAATLKRIRELGVKSAIVIKPCTSAQSIFDLLPLCDMVLVMSVFAGFGGQKFIPDALDKVRFLKQEIVRRGLHTLIEVDGGVNAQNAALLREAGADVLVAGSSVFKAPDMQEAILALKNA